MSKVVTTTVLPDVAGGSVTLGGTGDSVVVTGNDIRTNALQDAGGNAVFTSDGSGTMSGMNSGFGGALNLITTSTFTNQASVSYTTQLTSTYDIYIFKFIDMNPATNGTYLKFQANAVDASGYNETITSTLFWAHHKEDNSGTPALAYVAGFDQAQGTSFHILSDGIGNGGDESLVGELYLFNPSNTTYVKQFYATTQIYGSGDQSIQTFSAGYFNTTAAIDDIQFKMDGGNMDGVIKMYGISKS